MTDDAREKDAETIEGVLAMARHGRNDPAATLDAVVSALAALRTETSKPLGHEEEVDQWMYHVGPIPEGFTVEPVGIRTDGAGEQLDARVPLREALAVIARDVMPDEIADEVEEHVYRALAECGEVDAHEWLKRRGAGDLAQCEATNDGCRCQWRAGHDGMHTDGILFWDDEDSDAYELRIAQAESWAREFIGLRPDWLASPPGGDEPSELPKPVRLEDGQPDESHDWITEKVGDNAFIALCSRCEIDIEDAEALEGCPSEPAPVDEDELVEWVSDEILKLLQGTEMPVTDSIRLAIKIVRRVGTRPESGTDSGVVEALKDAREIAAGYAEAPCFNVLLGEVDDDNPCTCPTCAIRLILARLTDTKGD